MSNLWHNVSHMWVFPGLRLDSVARSWWDLKNLCEEHLGGGLGLEGVALRCAEVSGDLDSLQGLISSHWLNVWKSHWQAALAMASCLIQDEGGVTQLWTESNWWKDNSTGLRQSRGNKPSKSVHLKVSPPPLSSFPQTHSHNINTLVSGQERHRVLPSVDCSRGPRMTAWYRWHRYNLTTRCQLLRFYQAAREHLYFKVRDLGQNDDLLNVDELVKHFSPRWQKVSTLTITSDCTFLNFNLKYIFSPFQML